MLAKKLSCALLMVLFLSSQMAQARRFWEIRPEIKVSAGVGAGILVGTGTFCLLGVFPFLKVPMLVMGIVTGGLECLNAYGKNLDVKYHYLKDRDHPWLKKDALLSVSKSRIPCFSSRFEIVLSSKHKPYDHREHQRFSLRSSEFKSLKDMLPEEKLDHYSILIERDLLFPTEKDEISLPESLSQHISFLFHWVTFLSN